MGSVRVGGSAWSVAGGRLRPVSPAWAYYSISTAIDEIIGACRAGRRRESAALRDRLIADMAQLRPSDEAPDSAHKNMPIKNALTAADAEILSERPSATGSRSSKQRRPRSKADRARRQAAAEQSKTNHSRILQERLPGVLEGPEVGLMVLYDQNGGARTGRRWQNHSSPR